MYVAFSPECSQASGQVRPSSPRTGSRLLGCFALRLAGGAYGPMRPRSSVPHAPYGFHKAGRSMSTLRLGTWSLPQNTAHHYAFPSGFQSGAPVVSENLPRGSVARAQAASTCGSCGRGACFGGGYAPARSEHLASRTADSRSVPCSVV